MEKSKTFGVITDEIRHYLSNLETAKYETKLVHLEGAPLESLADIVQASLKKKNVEVTWLDRDNISSLCLTSNGKTVSLFTVCVDRKRTRDEDGNIKFILRSVYIVGMKPKETVNDLLRKARKVADIVFE